MHIKLLPPTTFEEVKFSLVSVCLIVCLRFQKTIDNTTDFD